MTSCTDTAGTRVRSGGMGRGCRLANSPELLPHLRELAFIEPGGLLEQKRQGDIESIRPGRRRERSHVFHFGLSPLLWDAYIDCPKKNESTFATIVPQLYMYNSIRCLGKLRKASSIKLDLSTSPISPAMAPYIRRTGQGSEWIRSLPEEVRRNFLWEKVAG